MGKMNERVKKLWIADLRKNRKLQGYQALKSPDNTFCCLGRLCELAVAEGIIPPAKLEKFQGEPVFKYVSTHAFLPKAVQKWAGLRHDPFVVIDKKSGCMDPLSSLNDSGHTFIQIAKLIEEQL